MTEAGIYIDEKPHPPLDVLESTYVPLSIHGGLLKRLAIDVHVAVEHMRTQLQRFALLDVVKK